MSYLCTLLKHKSGMKKFAIVLVCLLLAGTAAVWWFFRRGDKARDVLPADAAAAWVFEPMELVRELGFSLNDIRNIASSAGARWGKAIDFTKPVYAFVSRSGLTGVALNVKDREELLKLVASYGYASEEKQGFLWVRNGNSIGCLDDDKMLMLAPVPPAEQDARSDEMLKLMSQGKHDVPVLENAERQKGVLRFSSSLGNLPEEYSCRLPEDTDLSDISLNAALRVSGQNLTVSANVSGTSLSLPLDPISGNLAGMPCGEPFIRLCAGMKGERLLSLMRNVPRLRITLLGLNMMIDADLMIKAIDGDVTLVVPKADFERPDFLLTAALANTDFLRNAGEWRGRASTSLGKRGATDFVIKDNDNDAEVFFGVRDGRLYIASSAEMADMAMQQKAGADAFGKAAKGKYLYATLDAGQLLGASPEVAVLLQALPQVREVTDAVGRLSLSSDTPQSIEFNIETDKPIKDILLNTWKLLTGK